MYEVFARFFFIAQKWQLLSDRELNKIAGITTKQWMLLVVLETIFRNHLPTISEAAMAFGTSRQNLKRIASDLQKNGFLIIAKDPVDSRILRLALTGKHRPYFQDEENIKWQERFISELFNGLNEEDINSLEKATGILYNNIKERI